MVSLREESVYLPDLIQAVRRLAPASTHDALTILCQQYMIQEIRNSDVKRRICEMLPYVIVKQALRDIGWQVDMPILREELRVCVESTIRAPPVRRRGLLKEGYKGQSLLIACAHYGLFESGRRLLNFCICVASYNGLGRDGTAALREAIKIDEHRWLLQHRLRFVRMLIRYSNATKIWANVTHIKVGPAFEDARAQQCEGHIVPESAAAFLLTKVEGWTVRTHCLLPPPARAKASALMRIGYLLSGQVRWGNQRYALLDVWRDIVMRHAVVWDSGWPCPRGDNL